MDRHTFTPETLTRYLAEHIPISTALGIQIVSMNDTALTMKAPFTNNINHKKTVFGGSLQAVATLSCWSFFRTKLSRQQTDIIIVSSSMEFLKPTTGPFIATCTTPVEEEWERFQTVFAKKGAGKLSLTATISVDTVTTAQFTGTFAALET